MAEKLQGNVEQSPHTINCNWRCNWYRLILEPGQTIALTCPFNSIIHTSL